MGSPNNVDVVMGEARIPHREISAKEWCEILGHALRRIEPRLKYLAGFMTLAQLLNSRGHDNGLTFLTPNARLVTATKAMPTLDGTCLKQKTRFVILQVLEPKQDDGAKASHEIKRSFLLLTDGGNFVILNLATFKQANNVVVCGSSLMPNSLAGPFSLAETAICGCIAEKSISPYNVLDHLYLFFYRTVDDREKRLDQMRGDRDWLKGICDRIAIG